MSHQCVEFIDRGRTQMLTIPNEWISGDKFFWPNKSVYEAGKLFKAKTLPKDDWQRYKITRILKNGNESECNAVSSSISDNDESESPVYNDLLPQTSELALPIIPSFSPPKKKQHLANDVSFEVPDTQNLSFLNLCNVDNSSAFNNLSSILTHQPCFEESGNTSQSSSKKPSLDSLQETCNQILENQKKMCRYLVRLERRIDGMEGQNQVPVDKRPLVQIDNREELELCEERLGNPEDFTAMKQQISQIGGVDYRDAVRLAMNRIFTTTFMAQANLKGKKDKVPLEGKLIYRIIVESVNERFKDANEQEMRRIIGTKLRNAPSQRIRDIRGTLNV
ncbi:uncharacterized protein LOC130654746 [Hydractinia symbiolongicarpus]|uniref:uncharacterized protein LOC130635554 n=2 Tax=Hydractinia symbiolongicarpus TaxID=13093 RepID=UPI0025519739|nr:uncharacterized protein LOC130635554 [Hydractinia symbiolongicarpus]XP_057310314.1 uncharacterized protein LOC130648291 [Hydractinia symbiolongicarpus]XP_057313345.1 uncharacterized protein LOC130654746 [Hydractinia symbiolongicarpus]